jgi:hypothetical protein
MNHQGLLKPQDILSMMIKLSFGVDKYAFITKEIHHRDISKDLNYQRTFNSFYVVRRNAKWRKIYYDYFEKQKKNRYLTFEDIIRYLYKHTGFVEASFSSKLLSTINPKMPIWDVYVVKNLGLKTKSGKPLDKIEQFVRLYREIDEYFMGLINSEWGKAAISTFNNALPSYKWISDEKKIDFFIWKIR